MGDLCPCRDIKGARLRSVLHELASGRSEKEGASALGISVNTFHVHVGRLYAYFHVEGRHELMAKLIVTALGSQSRRASSYRRRPWRRPLPRAIS
jgi:DNA-binding CsgD family transcriptional regulator